MIRTIDECFWGIQNGANIKQSKSSGGFPITRIETIADNKFNRDRVGYAGITDVSSYESYILEDEDLLMSHINSAKYLGRTVLYNRRANEVIIHGMNLLRLRANKEIINPSYAKYLFSGCKFKKQVSRITKKSVNQASFTVGDLKKIKISVPSILEQVQIVEKLDKIAGIIKLRQAEIKKAEEIIKARFVEMFGEEKNKVKMVDICSIITDGTHESPKFVNEGIPFIFVSNISDNKIMYDADKYIDKATYDVLIKRTPIEIGDIILSTVGSYGHPAVVKSDKKFLFQRHIAYLKPKREMVNSEYLHTMIMMDYVQHQINLEVKGIAQKTLNLSAIKSLDVLMPSLSQQNAFAFFKIQVDKSKAVIEKSLKELETLQASLMQKYFS